MPPSWSETPKTAGFSGFLKSIWLLNCNIRMFSMECLYVLVALQDEENVPVSIPSLNLTLNPKRVSLNPSMLPLSSVNKLNLLLGLPMYPIEIVSFLAIGKY